MKKSAEDTLVQPTGKTGKMEQNIYLAGMPPTIGGNAPHHIARCWGRGRRACYVNPNMSYDYVGGKR